MLNSFISGLFEEIKEEALLFNPQSLNQAYKIAEREERIIEAIRRRGPINRSSFNSKTAQYRLENRQISTSKESNDQKGGREFLKGECFKCGDKWSPGHQCKGRTLHNIEGEFPEDYGEEEVTAKPGYEEEGAEEEVTLNSISCHSPSNTLKLTATVKGSEVQVLIDSGSTNSFVDPRVL